VSDLPSEQPFGDYYREIYARGMLANEQPTMPVSWEGLERAAEETLDPRAGAYIYGGAGSEDTMRANLAAFRRWRLVPRFMRPVGDRSLRTEVLETQMPAPVMLAPIGVQTLVHPDGELASAGAAGSLGVPIVVSTASAMSLEDIAQANGDSPRWYQLYWPGDDELTASLVRRAEDAGYGALVVTVDNYVPATSSMHTCPFWRASGLRSSRRIRSSVRPSTRRPKRTSARPSATTSECS
jgi:hypothetical protein